MNNYYEETIKVIATKIANLVFLITVQNITIMESQDLLKLMENLRYLKEMRLYLL